MKKFYGIFFIMIMVQITFAQKVTVPVLNAPEDEMVDAMPNVILDWQAVSGVGEISYHIQLAKDDAFSDLVVDEENADISAYYNEYLLFGQNYFWRVKASDDNGTSEWSEVFSFTTFNQVELKKPNDEEDEEDLRPRFKWEDEVGDNDITGGLDGFDLEIDTAASFDSPKNEVFFVEGLVFEYWPHFLDFGTTYFWRVRPRNPVDNGEWSEAYSFETLFSTELSDPDDGETHIEFDETFKWDDLGIKDDDDEDDIYSYTLQLDVHDDFSDPISFITMETEMTDPDVFKFGKEYFWRVKAIHAYDTSYWTETWSFTTVSTVVLDFPEDGTALSDIRLTLEWESLDMVSGYEIRLAKVADFSDAEIFVLEDGDIDEYPLLPLDIDEDYYWSVRAFKAADTSDWAETYTFNTKSIGIQEINNISNVNVYPSPANTNVSIEFFAQENMQISIGITDVVGKTISKEIIDVPVGRFIKSMDVSELTDGVYFIEMIQGNQKSISKFIVK